MKYLNRLRLDEYGGFPAFIIGIMLISTKPWWLTPLLFSLGILTYAISWLGKRWNASSSKDP